jgi:hypothetical protein
LLLARPNYPHVLLLSTGEDCGIPRFFLFDHLLESDQPQAEKTHLSGLEQALSTQISQHKKEEALRSCLEQLVGLVYHPDSDSLATLEKLNAEARLAAHGPVNLAKECGQQIRCDQEALAQRNEVDRVFGDIAENAVLLVRGRVGLAITLGTYALKHIKPADSLPNVVLGAGVGIVEGGVFRIGVHVAERATHHAGVTIMRYAKDALSPQLKAVGNFCADALKSAKPSPIFSTGLETTKPLLELLPETVIHRPLPASSAEAFNVVSELMGDTPVAADSGPLFIAEHNAQLANAEKAMLYHQSYEHMFSRAHLIFLEEVDPEFCRAAAAGMNYTWYASRVNSRGQGLGFLLHPRLEVIGEPLNLEALADVHHIPDLRPGFMLHLKDTHTGAQLDAIAVHLKSMRGGPYTHGVRYAQTSSLAKLISDCPTIIGGDWNFFLDRQEREMTPLARVGLQLIDPASNTPTQEWGGRLDGFMARNVPWSFSNCDVFNFWQRLPNRSFSDHGMLRTRMDVTAD